MPLKIDDRLEQPPENRAPLSGPPDAEIEISPSSVGMSDLYITTGRIQLGVHPVGSKIQSIDRLEVMDGCTRRARTAFEL